LLVPAEPAQLQQVGGDKRAYDLNSRPALMVTAIEELQDRGVEPDVWKIEGLNSRADCEQVVAAARRDGRDNVGCIVLGRGADEAQVRHWLETAAGIPGFVGFAVGRTTFWDALKGWLAGSTPREDAVAQIAANYRAWVEIFEQARTE
jgi:myo-inositol catabolism protein IolC